MSEDKSREGASEPLRCDHHYVAQAYLRRWADARGRVWTYRTLVSDDRILPWRSHAVRGTAYHPHLYSRHAHGRLTDEAERWLAAEVDGPSMGVLARIAEERPLTSTDWAVLVRAYVAAVSRSPAYYVRRRAEWDKELPPLVEDVLRRGIAHRQTGAKPPVAHAGPTEVSALPLPARLRTRRHADGSGGVLEAEVLAGRALWHFEIGRMVPYTSRRIRWLNWTVLRPPEGMSWITSDNPAVCALVTGDRRVVFNAGWGRRGAMLFMPLDPLHLMVAKVGARLGPKYSTMDAESAQFVQEAQAKHAFRLIFAIAPDERAAAARPRTVDRGLYEHEREQWAGWNESQSRSERELEDETTWPTSEATPLGKDAHNSQAGA